jgi:hypothetical protein
VDPEVLRLKERFPELQEALIMGYSELQAAADHERREELRRDGAVDLSLSRRTSSVVATQSARPSRTQSATSTPFQTPALEPAAAPPSEAQPPPVELPSDAVDEPGPRVPFRSASRQSGSQPTHEGVTSSRAIPALGSRRPPAITKASLPPGATILNKLERSGLDRWLESAQALGLDLGNKSRADFAGETRQAVRLAYVERGLVERNSFAIAPDLQGEPRPGDVPSKNALRTGPLPLVARCANALCVPRWTECVFLESAAWVRELREEMLDKYAELMEREVSEEDS